MIFKAQNQYFTRFFFKKEKDTEQGIKPNQENVTNKNSSSFQEDEEVAAEDEEDMGVIETYSNYKPTKLDVGLDHPDPVVETASLASVEPADVW